MKFNFAIRLFLLLVTIGLGGCSTMGSTNLSVNRADYNQALQQSADQQMLLNLVRLKYRASPMFLDVTSVSSQLSYTAGLSGSSSFSSGAKPSGAIGASLGYSEKPTISFAPLHGEKFTQQLLSQINLDRLALLYHSGWSVERLMLLCVQRINHIKNAPRASGPTPDTEPEFSNFQKVADNLRRLQLADALEVAYDNVSGNVMPVLYKKSSGNNQEWKEFLNAVGATPDTYGRLVLTRDSRKTGTAGFIHIQTRSFMGVMYLLSHGIEVASSDEQEGRVTVTKGSKDQRFDWRQVTGRLLQVHSSTSHPGDKAFAVVRYRNRWFFIADNDLNSKSTFSLMQQIFSLQGDKSSIPPPALTLSVGS
ncbi:MAG: hypothetical protein HQL70_04180 [Magnetococcales bacterium]|nr:hypothetical protein [Magnetococcales bacterium]